MNNLAIRVENLSKRYRIGARQAGYKTLRESLTSAFTAPFRRLQRTGDRGRKTEPPSSAPGPRSSVSGQPSTDGYIWALKDLSFEIKSGEVVGIIGRNGAGKSTLLKLLSRVTRPTRGRAEIYGRVGSLLEVGTGFHPELTGRENTYLNGAILGMSRAEIDRKFDEIVAFAEIEEFIDTPVKHYSSGMYVRLGFAVAAHLEPSVLLVDEVLAVGDAPFWTKSINRIRELQNQGMTVLLVTHNMWLVQTACVRAICLEKGEAVADGSPLHVIQTYQHRVAALLDTRSQRDDPPPPGETRLDVFRVHRERGWLSEKEASPDAGLRVEMAGECPHHPAVKFLIRVTSSDGLPYFTVYSDLHAVPPGKRIACEASIPHLMLLPGEYLLWGAICSAEGEDNLLAQQRLPFSVTDAASTVHKYGLFWNRAHWRVGQSE
ncbi:MAG: ABC transporter ATP-binding protein [candidate division NC10 bacterium]|nr:ABC transporter ATP-binding protein [candidate division NC10 bacterium]